MYLHWIIQLPTVFWFNCYTIQGPWLLNYSNILPFLWWSMKQLLSYGTTYMSFCLAAYPWWCHCWLITRCTWHLLQHLIGRAVNKFLSTQKAVLFNTHIILLLLDSKQVWEEGEVNVTIVYYTLNSHYACYLLKTQHFVWFAMASLPNSKLTYYHQKCACAAPGVISKCHRNENCTNNHIIPN